MTSPSDSGIESENGGGGGREGAGEVVDLNMMPAEPPAQEQEKTLTDHLNKKLLQSFLDRLETGRVDLPPEARGPSQEGDGWEDTDS